MLRDGLSLAKEMTAPTDSAPQRKAENLWLNLVCNVAVPTVVLSWGSGDKGLGPKWGMIVALLFPIGYGVHDFIARRRCNFISVIGFLSVLMSGSFGLMKLDGFWFAVKDGAFPAIIGLAVLVSMSTKEPLVHELLFNPQVIDVERVEAELQTRNARGAFAALMRSSSYLLAFSFAVSAVLNYWLARHILKSAPGTEAFNQELGRMHLLNWPVVFLPSMAMMLYALWRLMRGLEQLTGLTFNEIMRAPPEKDAAKPATPAPASPAAPTPAASTGSNPPMA